MSLDFVSRESRREKTSWRTLRRSQQGQAERSEAKALKIAKVYGTLLTSPKLTHYRPVKPFGNRKKCKKKLEDLFSSV